MGQRSQHLFVPKLFLPLSFLVTELIFHVEFSDSEKSTPGFPRLCGSVHGVTFIQSEPKRYAGTVTASFAEISCGSLSANRNTCTMWRTTTTMIMLAPQWCSPRMRRPAVTSVRM